MSYKHKYVPGWDYAFYNNSDDLEDNANFNYWTLDLLHADSLTVALDDVAPISKDIISGSDYRWYVDTFTFPDIDNGCYRFIVYDNANNEVIYIGDEIEVTDNTNNLTYVKFRNSKNILNYNYEVLTTFYNLFHVEMFKRKPKNTERAKGYNLVNGVFKRVRTTLSKSYEWITGWFDEEEHDATQAMSIHSDLNVGYDGELRSVTKDDSDTYEIEWQENYEEVQAKLDLTEVATGSSNKAV